jgi:hypothetical protein
LQLSHTSPLPSHSHSLYFPFSISIHLTSFLPPVPSSLQSPFLYFTLFPTLPLPSLLPFSKFSPLPPSFLRPLFTCSPFPFHLITLFCLTLSCILLSSQQSTHRDPSLFSCAIFFPLNFCPPCNPQFPPLPCFPNVSSLYMLLFQSSSPFHVFLLSAIVVLPHVHSLFHSSLLNLFPFLSSTLHLHSFPLDSRPSSLLNPIHTLHSTQLSVLHCDPFLTSLPSSL